MACGGPRLHAPATGRAPETTVLCPSEGHHDVAVDWHRRPVGLGSHGDSSGGCGGSDGGGGSGSGGCGGWLLKRVPSMLVISTPARPRATRFRFSRPPIRTTSWWPSREGRPLRASTGGGRARGCALRARGPRLSQRPLYTASPASRPRASSPLGKKKCIDGLRGEQGQGGYPVRCGSTVGRGGRVAEGGQQARGGR